MAQETGKVNEFIPIAEYKPEKKGPTRWDLLVEAGANEAGHVLCDMFCDCEICPWHSKCKPGAQGWIKWLSEEVNEL